MEVKEKGNGTVVKEREKVKKNGDGEEVDRIVGVRKEVCVLEKKDGGEGQE